MPDAGVLATILLILGLFLIALELMIPSFGMIGIMATVSLLISAWCAWQAWWGTSPGFFWTYAAFWVLGIPAVMGGLLYMIQNSRLGDNIVLKGPQLESVQAQSTTDGLEGQIGKAVSSLMPGGMVTVGAERFHAESRGMMIETGSLVEIIAVQGNRLIVKQAPADAVVSGESSQVGISEANSSGIDSVEMADAGTLDFEIPEG